MSKYDDVADLVKNVQAGDEAAFEILVHKYEKLAYYIILQNVRNTADALDIAQETFIEVRKSITKLNEPKYFKAWLNRVIFSKIARHYNKRIDIPIDQDKSSILQNMWEERSYMIPQKQSHFDFDKDILNACIAQLKPIYRDVLILRFFEELSMQEIAYALQIPEGTVKSRLNSAKSMLKEIIMQYEKEHNITLDFQSKTLEIAIASTFLASWKALGMPKVMYMKPWKKVLSKATANPILTTLVCGSVAVAGIGLAAPFFQTQQDELIKPSLQKQQYQEVDKFPVMMYRDNSVTTAREAYTILFDHYLKGSLEQEDDTKQLYQSLMDFGGSYADMLKSINKNI